MKLETKLIDLTDKEWRLLLDYIFYRVALYQEENPNAKYRRKNRANGGR